MRTSARIRWCYQARYGTLAVLIKGPQYWCSHLRKNSLSCNTCRYTTLADLYQAVDRGHVGDHSAQCTRLSADKAIVCITVTHPLCLPGMKIPRIPPCCTVLYVSFAKAFYVPCRRRQVQCKGRIRNREASLVTGLLRITREQTMQIALLHPASLGRQGEQGNHSTMLLAFQIRCRLIVNILRNHSPTSTHVSALDATSGYENS